MHLECFLNDFKRFATATVFETSKVFLMRKSPGDKLTHHEGVGKRWRFSLDFLLLHTVHGDIRVLLVIIKVVVIIARSFQHIIIWKGSVSVIINFVIGTFFPYYHTDLMANALNVSIVAKFTLQASDELHTLCISAFCCRHLLAFPLVNTKYVISTLSSAFHFYKHTFYPLLVALGERVREWASESQTGRVCGSMREGGNDVLSSECVCLYVCVCACVVTCALMEVGSVLFLECMWPVFACLSCGHVRINLNCCISCIKKTKKSCICDTDE